MSTQIGLSEAQRLALEKLSALIGSDQVEHIVAQGPEVLLARSTLLEAMRLPC